MLGRRPLIAQTKTALGWLSVISFLCIVAGFLHGFRLTLGILGLLTATALVYHAARILLKDAVNSICMTFLLFMLVSFSIYPVYATLAVLLLAGFILALRRKELLGNLGRGDVLVRRLSTSDAIGWGGICMLALLRGKLCLSGFYAVDTFHPLYELSMGRSFGRSLLAAPDLSYVGKTVKFHFLSTRLSIYFSELLGTDNLTSLFVVSGVFFVFVSFVVLNAFFFKHKEYQQSVWFIVFTPLAAAFSECVFARTVGGTVSYFAGFLLVVACVHNLIAERNGWLLMFAGALMLTKASFFVVMGGGMLLYFVRNRRWKSLVVPLVGMALIFFSSQLLFFKGAHQHNMWLLFPASLFVVKGSTVLGTLFLTVLFLHIYREAKCDPVMLALVSVSLSGLLGMWLVTEVTEANSEQFRIAAYFSTVLVLLYWFKRLWAEHTSGFLSAARKTGYVLYIVVICLAVGYTARPFLVNASLSSNGSLAELPLLSNTHERMRGSAVSSDLIEAYTWLGENSEVDSVVLFGKHYEARDLDQSAWWPDTGFQRSALSGRQLFCENHKYKGIGMEADYPLRSADAIHFYQNFVLLNEGSGDKLGVFQDEQFGKSPGLAMSQRKDLRARVAYYFSGKKDWSWVNRPEQIDYEISQGLARLQGARSQDDWAHEFLRANEIRFIVLEEGDKPSAFLESVSEVVYSNRTIMILELSPA